MLISSKEIQPSVHGLFIDGREVPASRSDLLDVINPATGELLAQISHASDEDVDRAVRSSQAAFHSPEWAGMSNRTRARLIISRKLVLIMAALLGTAGRPARGEQ